VHESPRIGLARLDRPGQCVRHPLLEGTREECPAEKLNRLGTSAPDGGLSVSRQFQGPNTLALAFCFWPFHRARLFAESWHLTGRHPRPIAAILPAAIRSALP
jgi:hypothetical protein